MANEIQVVGHPWSLFERNLECKQQWSRECKLSASRTLHNFELTTGWARVLDLGNREQSKYRNVERILVLHFALLRGLGRTTNGLSSARSCCGQDHHSGVPMRKQAEIENSEEEKVREILSASR